MPLLILSIVTIGLFLLIRHGQRMAGRMHLRFDGKRLQRVRGDYPRPGTGPLVEDVLREARVGAVDIRVHDDSRIVFSSGVPPELHQRLRNLLLR